MYNKSNFKKCPQYTIGKKYEGHLFRCHYDPMTRTAKQNNWPGVWCNICVPKGEENKHD